MYKIIFLFTWLLICCISVDAQESQVLSAITIQFKCQSLDSVLSQLEKQSGYRFIYQDNIADSSAKVNQKFEDKSIFEILDALLVKTDNSYAISGKRIVIYKKMGNEPKIFSTIGKVVDEKGEGVWGASVWIKGEESSKVTDRNGIFTISTINPDAHIVVAYLGYLPRVVHIKNAGLIKIEPDTMLLNTVFTIGSTWYVPQ